MSRYSLKPLYDRGDVFEVAVGWDAGFGTYFAIVYGLPESDGELGVSIWQGTLPGELPTTPALVAAITSIADMPPGILERLAEDKRDCLSAYQKPLTAMITKFLRYNQ